MLKKQAPTSSKMPLVGALTGSMGEAIVVEDTFSDPLRWQEEILGVNLFSNQIETSEYLFDPAITSFNVLACRGGGKSVGLAYNLAALCSMKPGIQVIIVGPIEKQASRLIRHIKGCMTAERSKAKKMLDLNGSSALRLVWKNGSVIVGISGQPKASVEGEHAPVIVIDEAHLVPTYSIKNKIMPMLMAAEGFRKVIKMGVSIGKGHFHSSVMAPSAVTSNCPWDQAEVYLHNESGRDARPLFYKGKQKSQQLIDMMPLAYKQKYFPDRPDLQKITGMEITELDWMTQYELDWVDDINNLLSEKDQDMLASGDFSPLTNGSTNERYFAGLDTAGGSITGRTDTDSTVLAIWRLRKNGRVDRVASFQWVGGIVEQKQEIWEICNPKSGLFRCELVLADHSNIAQEMIPTFRQMGMPILGVAFGGSAKSYGSIKNWKNTLFDHFMVQLQSGIICYPDIKRLKEQALDATPEERVQIENMLDGFGEWCVIQRIRSKGGINDKIEAPNDVVEDEDGSGTRVAHDDHCLSGDVGVRMLDGTTKTMAELSSSDISGAWVYSVSEDGEIRPGKLVKAWKTGDKKVLRITLDDGSSFKCTDNHRLMLRDGTYAEAGMLSAGQSLMPLYTKRMVLRGRKGKKNPDYEHVYNPASDSFEPTHRLVFGNVPEGFVRHHKNFNRFDNRPTNLQAMTWLDHAKLHGAYASETNKRVWASYTPEQKAARAAKGWKNLDESMRLKRLEKSLVAMHKQTRSSEGREKLSKRFLGKKAKPEIVAKMAATQKLRYAAMSQEERSKGTVVAVAKAAKLRRGTKFDLAYREKLSIAQKKRWATIPKDERVFNHKIESIEILGVEAVYDLTVEKYHNFALECGVFVHNCSSDVMAAFAARHVDKLKKDLTKSGGLIGYEIPMGVTGSASSSMGANTRNAGTPGQNPLAIQERRQLGQGGGGGGDQGSTLISDYIGIQKKS